MAEQQYHSLAEKDRPKFLVSWVEDSGMVRGQTVMDKAEASRLIKHLSELPTTLYAETRRIGTKIGSYAKKQGLQ